MSRASEIKKIVNLLHTWGYAGNLDYKQSIATKLVDNNIGTKDRFEVKKINISKGTIKSRCNNRYTVKPKEYSKEPE